MGVHMENSISFAVSFVRHSLQSRVRVNESILRYVLRHVL